MSSASINFYLLGNLSWAGMYSTRALLQQPPSLLMRKYGQFTFISTLPLMWRLPTCLRAPPVYVRIEQGDGKIKPSTLWLSNHGRQI